MSSLEEYSGKQLWKLLFGSSSGKSNKTITNISNSNEIHSKNKDTTTKIMEPTPQYYATKITNYLPPPEVGGLLPRCFQEAFYSVVSPLDCEVLFYMQQKEFALVLTACHLRELRKTTYGKKGCNSHHHPLLEKYLMQFGF